MGFLHENEPTAPLLCSFGRLPATPHGEHVAVLSAGAALKYPGQKGCRRMPGGVFAGSQLQQIEAEVHFSHLLIVLTQGSLLTSQNLFLLRTLWMEMGSYRRSEMRTQE